MRETQTRNQQQAKGGERRNAHLATSHLCPPDSPSIPSHNGNAPEDPNIVRWTPQALIAHSATRTPAKTDLDPCWISPKSVTDTFRLPVLACQLATVCGSGMTELQDLARIVETLSPSGIANFSSSLHEMGELRLERAHRRQINKSLQESVLHVCVAVQGL